MTEELAEFPRTTPHGKRDVVVGVIWLTTAGLTYSTLIVWVVADVVGRLFFGWR